MPQRNLVMMGLRGLLLELIKKHQGDSSANRSLREILDGVQLPDRVPSGENALVAANLIAYAAELRGVEQDMKLAAIWSLLDGEANLERLVNDFLEPQSPVSYMN